MGLPKFSSVSTLSLAGVVLLIGGLGLTIVASQQQQDQRSEAASGTYGDCLNGSRGGLEGHTCVPSNTDICCSKSCAHPYNDGKCEAESRFPQNYPLCVKEPGGGKCKSSCSSTEVAYSGKGCVSGTKCCKPKPPTTCVTDTNYLRTCSVPQNGCATGYSGTGNYSCGDGYLCCQKPRNCSVLHGGVTVKGSCVPSASCGSQGGSIKVTGGNCGTGDVCCVANYCGANGTAGSCKGELLATSCPSGSTKKTGANSYCSVGVCCVSSTQAPQPQPPAQPPSGGGDAQYIGDSCTTPQGGGTCQYKDNRDKNNCTTTGGKFVTGYCKGSTNVVCCVKNTQPPQPQDCGDASAPTGTVVSQNKETKVSAVLDNDPTYNGSKAVDGDNDTFWNAGNYPPQWIQINLGSKKTITGLKLRVRQEPSGLTTHQIYTGSSENPQTLRRTLSCVTENHQMINVVFPEPLADTQYVQIKTTSSPSWMAWEEIEAYSDSGSGGEQSGNTTFDLNLLMHGIGKGGDKKNKDAPGSTPKDLTRQVFVEVYDLDNNPVVQGKSGEVKFDSNFGGYKGEVDLGTVLQKQAYVIKVKLTHSLWGSITRTITAGAKNTIPAVKLVNGDANNDAKLNILDFNIVNGCVEDIELGIPATNCDENKKPQADIDADGLVDIRDLGLIIREMSLQN